VAAEDRVLCAVRCTDGIMSKCSLTCLYLLTFLHRLTPVHVISQEQIARQTAGSKLPEREVDIKYLKHNNYTGVNRVLIMLILLEHLDSTNQPILLPYV